MIDYYDIYNFPRLDSDRVTLQTSSFDRKYENGDFDQFLYREDSGETVLFDDKGDGVITSIWTAVATDDTEIAFYFGGESVPTAKCTLKELFLGVLPQISGPANTYEERGHFDGADCRCGNCFVPVPYKNRLKITARGKTDFYYHIMYEKSASGKPLEPVPDVNSVFESGKLRNSKPVGKITRTEAELKPGYNTVYTAEGAGVITEFTFEADEDIDLSKIQLDVVWDNERISQIAAPLSHFFAQPLGFTPVDTGAVKTKRTKSGRISLSLYLPMPYWESAAFCFVNQGTETVSASLTVETSENRYDRNNTGYLYAFYREGKTELFRDWHIGSFSGRGHVAGLVQTCFGGQYCEGNEHFYIDKEKTPRINGTGTEDLYLACYWPNRRYDSLCAGCINDVYEENGGTLKGSFNTPAGYYRFFHDMPISFSNGIIMDIQHGAVCQTYSEYTSMCFVYRKEEAAMAKTDSVYPAVPGSESLHGYSRSGGELHTASGKLQSDMNAPLETKIGYRYENSQWCSFKAAVNADNRGVCLRRLFDQSLSPQCCKVYADGEYIGEWYDPNYNEHYIFADSDFYIPASVTSGKSILNIRLEACGVFTDFEYEIFSMI